MARRHKKYRAPKPRAGKPQDAKKKQPATANDDASSVAAPAAAPAATPKPRVAAFHADSAFPPNGLANFGRNFFLIALMLLVALPPFIAPYGIKYGYTPDLHILSYTQTLSVLILLLFFITRFTYGQVAFPRTPVFLPMAALFAWGTLSMLWARAPYHSMLDAAEWGSALIAAALVGLLVKNMGMMRALIVTIALSGFVMAVLGIAQFLFAYGLIPQYIAPGGTFNNKNMFGQYIVITFPLMLAVFFASRSVLGTWLSAIAAALMFSAAFYSRARGTWLAIGVEVVVILALLLYLRFALSMKLFPTWNKKVAAAAMIALTLGMSYLSPSMFITEDDAQETAVAVYKKEFEEDTGYDVAQSVADEGIGASGDIRFSMWGNSMYMFADHWLLGVGLGNWTNEYDAYQSSWRQDVKLLDNFYHANAHNDYVEILVELGIIGFGIFLWLLYKLLASVAVVLRNMTMETLYALGPIIALTGFATNAMFSFPLKQPSTSLLAISYVFILGVFYAGLKRSRPRTFRMPVITRAMAVGVLALAVVGTGYWHYLLYQSELGYRTAITLLKTNKYGAALREATAARHYNPIRPVLLWVQASSLLGLRRPERAVELYERMLEYNPRSSATALNLVSAYTMLGRHSEAADVMRRLNEVHDRERKSMSKDQNRLQEVKLLINAGRYDEALPVIKRMLEQVYYWDAYVAGEREALDPRWIEFYYSYNDRYITMREEANKMLDAIERGRAQRQQMRQQRQQGRQGQQGGGARRTGAPVTLPVTPTQPAAPAEAELNQ